MKILIVEDNEASRYLLALNFSQEGYSVISARDGEEGLLKLIEERPRVVIADLHMPGMHGSEMIRKIRRRSESQHTKVVVLTGQDAAVGERAREAGADVVLYKPLSFDSLKAVVQRLLVEAAAS